MKNRVIDCHCHVNLREWTTNHKSKDYIISKMNDNITEEQVLTNMAEAEVEKTIVMPLPTIDINIQAANQYVLYMSKLMPDKFIPFTIVDNNPHKWLANGAAGFKEHTYGLRIQRNSDGENIFSDKYKESYKCLETAGKPLLLHAGDNKIDRVRSDLLKDTPKLKIIIAHLGADYPPNIGQIEIVLKALRDCKTVVFDISTIKDIQIVHRAIEIVGAHKILYGSDYPYEKPKTALERLKQLNLSEKELNQILYYNIASILGIKDE